MFASFEKFLAAIGGGILLVAMMLLVTADVMGRFFFSIPVQGTTELTEFIMVALLYLSLAHTQALKGHINVDIFLSFFKRRTRLVFDLIAYLLGLVLFALIGWQGILAAIKAWTFWETTFGVLPFPLFPAKVLIPFGSFLVCLRYLLDIKDAIKTLSRKESSLARP
jgi:TRAP-type C4-dicarboxylate transport system permease small subunit